MPQYEDIFGQPSADASDQILKAGVCFTLGDLRGTADPQQRVALVSFVTAPIPSEYTEEEEERHVLLVISPMDERYADDARQSNLSLLLGRDDAFRDPDQIRLCLEVEFPLQCNDWLILGFAG